jgi:hypothetical protein
MENYGDNLLRAIEKMTSYIIHFDMLLITFLLKLANSLPLNCRFVFPRARIIMIRFSGIQLFHPP